MNNDKVVNLTEYKSKKSPIREQAAAAGHHLGETPARPLDEVAKLSAPTAGLYGVLLFRDGLCDGPFLRSLDSHDLVLHATIEETWVLDAPALFASLDEATRMLNSFVTDVSAAFTDVEYRLMNLVNGKVLATCVAGVVTEHEST